MPQWQAPNSALLDMSLEVTQNTLYIQLVGCSQDFGPLVVIDYSTAPGS